MTMKKSTLITSLFLAGSFMVSSAVFADPGHGKGQDKQARNWTQQQKHYKDDRKQNQRYNPSARTNKNHARDHDRGDSRTGRYLTHEQYRQLPPGLQKNVARGKAVPPGWAKKTRQSLLHSQAI